MLRISVLLLMSCYLVCAAPAQTQMKMEVGRLHISSVPEGCTVLLDNRLAGTTPALLDSIPEGAHVVVVRKEGFCSVVDTIAVEAGALKDHAVALEPECILSVVSDPADAAIYLNGIFYGRTPMRIGQLTKGQYTVLVMRRDYERWTDTVHLAVGSPVHRRAVLIGRPPTVSILTADSSVEIFVNNVSMGYGSKHDLAVPSGEVSLKLWRQSTNAVLEGRYSVPPAARQVFKADFDRPSHAAFWWSLLVPGLGQFLDGSRIKGVIIATGFIAAVSNVNEKLSNVSSKNAAYQEALRQYHATHYSPTATALRAPVQSAYDEACAAPRARNLSICIAAGVYVVNALDAWFFHDSVSELISIDNTSLTQLNDHAMPLSEGVTVTVRIPL